MSTGFDGSFRCLKCKKTVRVKISQSGEEEEIQDQDKIFGVGSTVLTKLKALHGKNCIFTKVKA